MTLLAFKEQKRPDVFIPVCKEGHLLDGLDCIKLPQDIVLIDSKGWAHDVCESEIIRLDGRFLAEVECELCLEHKYPRTRYRWNLDFTCGLLWRVQQLPDVKPDNAKEERTVIQLWHP